MSDITNVRRVSGDFYGYSLDRTADGQYSVTLRWRETWHTVSALSYESASNIGEAFADCGRAWRIVLNRQAALAKGYAVLGW